MALETELGKSYLGIARVHARLFGSTGKFRFVGNVSALTPSHKLDVQKQRDYTRLGGGTAVRVARIESVELSMTWLTFSPENMALAVAGDAATVSAATITDEVIKGYKGATVQLEHPPASITTVKNSAGTTTYDEGDDYEMTASGVGFPPGSSITDAADLKVTYEHDDYVNVEAATQTNTELEMLVEGLNDADSGNAVLANLWRASLPAADELALISDKLGELKFSAELLKDPTKGSGVSAFYRIRQVTPAA